MIALQATLITLFSTLVPTGAPTGAATWHARFVDDAQPKTTVDAYYASPHLVLESGARRAIIRFGSDPSFTLVDHSSKTYTVGTIETLVNLRQREIARLPEKFRRQAEALLASQPEPIHEDAKLTNEKGQSAGHNCVIREYWVGDHRRRVCSTTRLAVSPGNAVREIRQLARQASKTFKRPIHILGIDLLPEDEFPVILYQATPSGGFSVLRLAILETYPKQSIPLQIPADYQRRDF